jgi:UDP:flavonoid glycosyltransferase YjiC (YdhE family)
LASKKRILIAPLDWGLGHATRCVPIIRMLQEQGAEVVIAADGGPLTLLKQEFPTCETVDFAGYGVRYPKGGNMGLKMLLEAPKILQRIKSEQVELKQIIADHSIDAVISDNRFGAHSDEVPCVFMTHQVHIQAPLFSKALCKINASYMDKFTEVWAPDLPGARNLSGNLCHGEPLPKHLHYIGPLSRFDQYDLALEEEEAPQYEVMAIISGPEPQRSAFETVVLDALKRQDRRAIMVRGLPNETEFPEVPAHITIHNHLPAEELATAIVHSHWVLARPGYSTLMDLAYMLKKAVFIPTPGQTEQEYLGELHQAAGHYFSMPQSKFDFEVAAKQVGQFDGIKINFDANLLRNRIVALLDRL